MPWPIRLVFAAFADYVAGASVLSALTRRKRAQQFDETATGNGHAVLRSD